VSLSAFMTMVQLFFAIVVGLYFWNALKTQQGSRTAVDREARQELERLRQLRAVALTEPLAERTRPRRLDDIVGQGDGIRGLRAALCGPNPQHVIVYGPPGVGKTAAARLVLDEAKRNPVSPFRADARFVEVDATAARFDERGIADPLIGSVHDPIYQGAGPLGMAGIPQPKPGAVTKAHGGILFIDEIGELHHTQINKLLKVLEDRKVLLESAYYNREDRNIPAHVRDIFENGLPADFRLVGATTRQPHELPAAIRSRCVEIFFRPLTAEEVGQIAQTAADKVGVSLESGALDVISRYCHNGREAVNLVQIAAGLALSEGRRTMRQEDAEWVVNTGQYSPRPELIVHPAPQVGLVYGLAVYGPNTGMVIEIEAVARPATGNRGQCLVTGVIDEEEMGAPGRTVRRQSTARSSIDNVLTALACHTPITPSAYDIHVNFPGGVPVDGPSAGAAVAVAVYSAVTGHPIRPGLAVTGEVSIRGEIRAVGGVPAKIEAARLQRLTDVLIPAGNWQARYGMLSAPRVAPVETVVDVLARSLAIPDDALGPPADRQTAGLSKAPAG
jgi:Lon-like ATP-dependent protease